MKYLIVGLGNIGSEYEGTRHNCGFMAVDALLKGSEARFGLERHAYRAELRHKGRHLIVIKPTTYMNLSGKAVKYWMQQERVPLENVLVVVDDIALPVGALRMKKQGSGGGHNGLGNIEEAIGPNYCRLRIGVGDNFSRGKQIDYVLGKFSSEEIATLEPKLEQAAEMIKTFCTQGPDRAMNMFNGK
ncbi:MAG: aminoacyl-tRNA hydrolase [Bacteroidales bacterium]|nr:aminoacyl-tRNA hydrolase [Bacteroidales bacterium]